MISIKQIKAAVTISRVSDGTIRLRVEDSESRIEFVELSMSPADFANAITGLACQPAVGGVRGLEYVGKTKVTEARQVECPLGTFDKEKLSAWLESNCQEEGWLLSSYLGSQSSVVRADDKTTLNYSVTKYVDQEES